MSHLDFLKLESHEMNQFHTDGRIFISYEIYNVN